LSNAYETISDLQKRQAYDIQWVHIKRRQGAQQEAKKRQAEAAGTERKKTAEEHLKRQREQRAPQERLRPLEELRFRYDSDVFEVNRVIRRLIADLKRLQDQDDEALRKERERKSWWTYLTSPMYGKAQETAEQKQQRATERYQKIASKRIKGIDLKQQEARLQILKISLQNVNSKIAAEKQKNEYEAQADAARRQEEQLRKEQEAKKRSDEQRERERQAKWEAAHAELRREAAREARAREARQATEAQERMRKEKAAREAARKVQEAEARLRAAREVEAALRNGMSKPATTSNSSHRASNSTKKDTCQHEAFWPKLEGSHLCSQCCVVQRRFAFRCPGCQMIACANCRQSLRAERARNWRGSGRRFANDSSDASYAF
jgi:hypothetical protein